MHLCMCLMEEEGWSFRRFCRLNLIIHLENVKEDTVLFCFLDFSTKKGKTKVILAN